ncbi:hypothetical protein MLD38_026882 [Melastoma candidum]|uniref:Uncharacterized protein n=1 Tax=Melastoma candidum TaxID=119954 RepID=A0ACB9NZY8_9MYRT|nr:hypothetical protein MLD38_026882 [Melastoma candidum]
MNAFSFGFVAAAVLVSLFLVMAVFEHLFGPSPSFASPEPISVSSMLEHAGDDARGSPSNLHCTACSPSAILSERRNTLASPSTPPPTWICLLLGITELNAEFTRLNGLMLPRPSNGRFIDSDHPIC